MIVYTIYEDTKRKSKWKIRNQITLQYRFRTSNPRRSSQDTVTTCDHVERIYVYVSHFWFFEMSYVIICGNNLFVQSSDTFYGKWTSGSFERCEELIQGHLCRASGDMEVMILNVTEWSFAMYLTQFSVRSSLRSLPERKTCLNLNLYLRSGPSLDWWLALMVCESVMFSCLYRSSVHSSSRNRCE
jgi:hypothetical protein